MVYMCAGHVHEISSVYIAAQYEISSAQQNIRIHRILHEISSVYIAAQYEISSVQQNIRIHRILHHACPTLYQKKLKFPILLPGIENTEGNPNNSSCV